MENKQYSMKESILKVIEIFKDDTDFTLEYKDGRHIITIPAKPKSSNLFVRTFKRILEL